MTAKALKQKLATIEAHIARLEAKKAETTLLLAAAQDAERQRPKSKKPSKKAPHHDTV